MTVCYKLLCAFLVVAGTYLLSKNLFQDSLRRQINLKYDQLPWYLRWIIILFFTKKKYMYGDLWKPNYFPMPEHFPWSQRLQIMEPFIGFVLICLGAIGALFF